MAFFDFFRPKWKHNDKYVRENAVKNLKNPKILIHLAKNDSYSGVRMLAIRKLTDQKVIAEIALNDLDQSIRLEAVKNLKDQNILAEIAMHDKELDIREAAVKNLTDINILSSIAKNKKDIKNIRIVAINNLTNLTILSEIAVKESNFDILLTAMDKVAEIAKASDASLLDSTILDIVDYHKTIRSDYDIEIYNEYLEKHPNGIYVKQVKNQKAKLEVEFARRKHEEEMFELVVRFYLERSIKIIIDNVNSIRGIWFSHIPGKFDNSQFIELASSYIDRELESIFGLFNDLFSPTHPNPKYNYIKPKPIKIEITPAVLSKKYKLVQGINSEVIVYLNNPVLNKFPLADDYRISDNIALITQL